MIKTLNVRNKKGSALTHDELDENFVNIQTAKRKLFGTYDDAFILNGHDLSTGYRMIANCIVTDGTANEIRNMSIQFDIVIPHGGVLTDGKQVECYANYYAAGERQTEQAMIRIFRQGDILKLDVDTQTNPKSTGKIEIIYELFHTNLPQTASWSEA